MPDQAGHDGGVIAGTDRQSPKLAGPGEQGFRSSTKTKLFVRNWNLEVPLEYI